jgi:hypothetical protein
VVPTYLGAVATHYSHTVATCPARVHVPQRS